MISVKVENDANAAGLAEYIWGAARGYRYVFYATLGTGIGTGIVLDGKIYWGRTGAAAEGGHVTIDWHGPVCNCGKRGCIEILASGPAIAVRAREKVLEEPRRGAAILQSARGDISNKFIPKMLRTRGVPATRSQKKFSMRRRIY